MLILRTKWWRLKFFLSRASISHKGKTVITVFSASPTAFVSPFSVNAARAINLPNIQNGKQSENTGYNAPASENGHFKKRRDSVTYWGGGWCKGKNTQKEFLVTPLLHIDTSLQSMPITAFVLLKKWKLFWEEIITQRNRKIPF